MLAPADQQGKSLQNRNKHTKCVDDPAYDKRLLILTLALCQWQQKLSAYS